MTTTTLPLESRDLALELRGLLEAIEPGQWKASAAEAVRRQMLALGDRVQRVLQSVGGETGGSLAGLTGALREAHRVLTEHLPAAGLAGGASRRAWKRFRADLLAVYQRLGATLTAWDIHVPSMRPTNYARNVLHVGSAVFTTLFVAFVPSPWMYGSVAAITVWAWTMEYFRRHSPGLNRLLMASLGAVAHPHEWYRVNSASWYSTAMLLLATMDWLTAGLVGVAVLGVGDPAAAIIGRRFGRTRLMNGRSLEGTAAFVVTGTLAAMLSLTLLHPEIPTGVALAACLLGATLGGIAELVSRRVDDNFTIPLTASVGAAIVLAAAGLGL